MEYVEPIPEHLYPKENATVQLDILEKDVKKNLKSSLKTIQNPSTMWRVLAKTSNFCGEK